MSLNCEILFSDPLLIMDVVINEIKSNDVIKLKVTSPVNTTIFERFTRYVMKTPDIFKNNIVELDCTGLHYIYEIDSIKYVEILKNIRKLLSNKSVPITKLSINLYHEVITILFNGEYDSGIKELQIMQRQELCGIKLIDIESIIKTFKSVVILRVYSDYIGDDESNILSMYYDRLRLELLTIRKYQVSDELENEIQDILYNGL